MWLDGWQMSEQDQIKALATIDGWRQHPKYEDVLINSSDTREAHVLSDTLRQYLTSYDAIIPLIQKQGSETLFAMYSWLRSNAFVEAGNPSYLPVLIIAFSLPAQLCEALLRATGKWIE